MKIKEFILTETRNILPNRKLTFSRIVSPIVVGSGSYVVHKTLQKNICGYELIPYSPYRTFFPPSLFLLGRSIRTSLIHTTPDYAIFHHRSNVPLIITFHNYVLDTFMFNYSHLFQKLHYLIDLRIFIQFAVKKAHMITAVSKFVSNLIISELQVVKEPKQIYNGVDHHTFIPKKSGIGLQANTIKVIFSGNLTKRKGAQWLLPIADELMGNVLIRYTLGLRTSIPLTNHPKLQCLGNIPYEAMPMAYQDTDIFLLLTVREGFPLAVLEAMACGLPVVASNCSSIPELVDDGKGGFLCPIGDVDAFAEKINMLADSPRLRKEMGEYNRVKVEKEFTVERMVREYKELFEEVLDTPKGRRC